MVKRYWALRFEHINGNPQFKTIDGLDIADYTSSNVELIRVKGIEIEKILNGTIGLKKD